MSCAGPSLSCIITCLLYLTTNLVRYNCQNVRDMIRVWIPSYHQLQNKVYLTSRVDEDLVSRTWGSPSPCTEWR